MVAAVGKKVLAGAAKKAIGAVASKVGDKVGEKITGGSPAEMSHKKGHSAAKMAKKSPTKMKKDSKYGKKHDNLRAKGHKARDKAMDAFDAGKERKADRLDKRADKKLGKARDIRVKSAEKESPAKKALVGKQKNLPDHLKAKILAAPGKMKKSAAKMIKKSPNKLYKKKK